MRNYAVYIGGKTSDVVVTVTEVAWTWTGPRTVLVGPDRRKALRLTRQAKRRHGSSREVRLLSLTHFDRARMNEKIRKMVLGRFSAARPA